MPDTFGYERLSRDELRQRIEMQMVMIRWLLNQHDTQGWKEDYLTPAIVRLEITQSLISEIKKSDVEVEVPKVKIKQAGAAS